MHDIAALLSMPAGRELDAVIALKLFGRRYTNPDDLPRYSTEIAAAWTIVELMGARHTQDFRLGNRFLYGQGMFTDRWQFAFMEKQWSMFFPFKAEASTAPLAICRAALAAVESAAQEVEAPVEEEPAEAVEVTTAEEDDDDDSPYCPDCGACGIDGCCPPTRCLHLSTYHRDYDSMSDACEAINSVLAKVAQLDITLLDRVQAEVKDDDRHAQLQRKILDDLRQ